MTPVTKSASFDQLKDIAKHNLRDDFDASDGEAAQQCHELLSGRKQ